MKNTLIIICALCAMFTACTKTSNNTHACMCSYRVKTDHSGNGHNTYDTVYINLQMYQQCKDLDTTQTKPDNYGAVYFYDCY